MSPELLALGRRAVACKDWRWLRGCPVRALLATELSALLGIPVVLAEGNLTGHRDGLTVSYGRSGWLHLGRGQGWEVSEQVAPQRVVARVRTWLEKAPTGRGGERG